MKSFVALLLFLFSVSALSVKPQKPWKRHTIDPTDVEAGKKGADGVKLADVNRDRLMDVVTGWENGKAIRVCLNPGPEKSRDEWPAVTVGKVKDAEDAMFSDLDGDLRVDAISACEGKTRTVYVHWAPTERDDYLKNEAWKTEPIPCTVDKAHWMFLITFDVNRDGAADIITGSKGKDGAVGWLENPGQDVARDLSKWKWHKIASAAWIMSLRDIDLDGDGHREIIYSDRKGGKSGIYAFSHENKAPWFTQPVRLGFADKEVMFLDIADLNDDGKKDIAVAIRPDSFGFLYQPAEKPWRSPWESALSSPISNKSLFGQSKAVRVADIDLDGELDICATCEHANGDLSGVYHFPYSTDPDKEITATDIGGPEGVKFDRIELIDLDKDGDLDLMTCEERDGLGVFWYENPEK